MKTAFSKFAIALVAFAALSIDASAQTSEFVVGEFPVNSSGNIASTPVVSAIGESTYFETDHSDQHANIGSPIDTTYQGAPVDEPQPVYQDHLTHRGKRTFSVLAGWDLEFASLDTPADGPFHNVNSYDRTNYAISVAAGRHYRSWLRSEIEFAIRRIGDSSEISIPEGDLNNDFELTILSLMKNAIIEWDNNSRFTPYAGLGIGISYVNMQDDLEFIDPLGVSEFSFDESDTVFSWQVIAGLGIGITERLDFVTEYRYFSTLDINFSGGGSLGRFWSNNLFFGVRREF